MKRWAEDLEQQGRRMVRLQDDNERLAIACDSQKKRLERIKKLARDFSTTKHETIATEMVAHMIKTALEQ